MAKPVLLSERSFLLTAAGQFRIFADSLLSLTTEIRHRKVVLNIVQPLCTGQLGAAAWTKAALDIKTRSAYSQ
jgi:hypothetical protein